MSGFTIEVPRKRERNAFVISQAKGEALHPQRMADKHKAAKRVGGGGSVRRGGEDWRDDEIWAWGDWEE